jgi:hypothetical protein
VLSRVQGMEAAYRGLDVLADVISLRSGQKWEEELKKRIADVFYLFGCRHAKNSEWVRGKLPSAASPSARLLFHGSPRACRSPDPVHSRPYSRCVGRPAFIDASDRG